MKMVALIDYGSGNLHSAARALREASRFAKKTREIRVTSDPAALASADRIVLPGVGHFADCAANLRARPGLVDALREQVIEKQKPFLGICVGMQLMATTGTEDGATPGLDWISGTVDRITPGDGHRIPHMGWNNLALRQPIHPVLQNLDADPHVYFTHSYAFRATKDDDIAATADYGAQDITAAIARGNLFGTQFHPEKSQTIGLKLLHNFLLWQPA